MFSDSGPVLLDAGEVRFDFGNSFPYEGAPQRLFKVVTAEEDADGTVPAGLGHIHPRPGPGTPEKKSRPLPG